MASVAVTGHRVKWRVIPDFPGYMASDDGRVWSLYFKHPRPIKPEEWDGYWTVRLWRKNKRVRMNVSRVVAMAFHGEAPSRRHDASHLNGNRKDNRASNLIWEMRSDNNRRIKAKQRRAKMHVVPKPKPEDDDIPF